MVVFEALEQTGNVMLLFDYFALGEMAFVSSCFIGSVSD